MYAFVMFIVIVSLEVILRCGMSIALSSTEMSDQSLNRMTPIFRRKEISMFPNTTKVLFMFFTIAALWLLSSPYAFAADVIPEQASLLKVIFSVGAMVGAGFAIGLGCIGAGAGIGSAAAGGSEAVGRNPAAQGKIMMTMMVGMAMAESIAIYALVISLILLYANPYRVFVFG